MKLSKFIYDHEFDIRDRLKAIVKEAKAAAEETGRRHKGKASFVRFSISGLARRQAKAVHDVGAAGLDVRTYKSAIHDGFDSLSRGPAKSAACVYERFRARLTMLAKIAPLFADGENVHTVALAKIRHRLPVGSLHHFRPTAALRMVKMIHRELRRRGIASKVFGVVEVSLIEEDGARLYEPHVHMIIIGPTREELSAVVPGSPRYDSQIDTVYHAGGSGLYFTKFEAEERVGYEDRRGKQNRQRNRMQASERAEWLDWHARHGMAELMILAGFQPGLMRQFMSADLRELVREFLGIRRREHG
ncbi:hypothetical protein FJ417_00145 [Mesorhizobium sp. B3-1-7]|uniref:hypothetical protein n=1 Tax=Mesorhizobium sp. B3-1-7 TaxID=2589894 RepID=UPI001125E5D2|nr:hypothetical protein [Mesorhizobium sp. B3-1-7]TPI65032.1 hypothetical protein FJ417_00145 [Mesorhizobium sp. B3-1-7]